MKHVNHYRTSQVELTAPSAWASYLIMGDASGMSEDDLVACDSWCAARFVGEGLFDDKQDERLCEISTLLMHTNEWE